MLQLNESEALQGNVHNSPFKEFERTFKRVWGNNAAAISLYHPDELGLLLRSFLVSLRKLSPFQTPAETPESMLAILWSTREDVLHQWS
ncbi:hypothetical protein JG688_00014427 [Phytophthora aleatoria]|uniref:Uncharacterized protein n=1 Tax=Phytophthora aleatoria TaxID=2496075 RepID=A0A8J5IG08_9STRA|nr:hypothetical protein JG688_00014427 [Phytophthora aleatoria]